MLAMVYVGTLAVIFFDGTEVTFDYDAYYLRLNNTEDILKVSGFLRDCANYMQGTKKEVKDLKLIRVV